MAKRYKPTKELQAEHAASIVMTLRILADEVERRGLVGRDASFNLERVPVEVDKGLHAVKTFLPTGEVRIEASWRLAPEAGAVTERDGGSIGTSTKQRLPK